MRPWIHVDNLCPECKKWNPGWDDSHPQPCTSMGPGWEQPPSEDGKEQVTMVIRSSRCFLCRTWVGKPHFLLQVLNGRLSEPLDPHSVEMNPSLWSKLPQECLDAVLARVPLGSRVRFSTVSKDLQSLFASTDFKRLCDSVQPQPALPICSLQYRLGEIDDQVYFDPPAKTASETGELEVVEVSLSFLPPKFQAFGDREFLVKDGLVCIFKLDKPKPEPRVHQRVVWPVTFSHGTGAGNADGYEYGKEFEEELKMELEEHRDRVDDSWKYLTPKYIYKYPQDYNDESTQALGMSFCVANPITRTFKELPPHFGMEVYKFDDYPNSWKFRLEVEESGKFTVIVMGAQINGTKCVSIYRSEDDCWKATALNQPQWFSVHVRGNDWPQYFLCNADQLCQVMWSSHLMKIHCLESGRVIWDGKEEVANADIDTLAMHMARSISKFFAFRGRIFCLEQDHPYSGLVDIGIWQLERSPYVWCKVSSLPEHLRKMHFEGDQRRRRTKRVMIRLEGVTLLGDTLYFPVGVGGPLGYAGVFRHLMGYNLLHNEWSLISKCESGFIWNQKYSTPLFRPNGSGV